MGAGTCNYCNSNRSDAMFIVDLGQQYNFGEGRMCFDCLLKWGDKYWEAKNAGKK
ncbi:hypothetical protein HYT84_02290 [Candidatus Micrarchaeota archaeon]|nr:hypothetical protein [Candidatus Micrarchaeota archaeon]